MNLVGRKDGNWWLSGQTAGPSTAPLAKKLREAQFRMTIHSGATGLGAARVGNERTEKQILFEDDKQEKQGQKQVLRLAQDDNYIVNKYK